MGFGFAARPSPAQWGTRRWDRRARLLWRRGRAPRIRRPCAGTTPRIVGLAARYPRRLSARRSAAGARRRVRSQRRRAGYIRAEAGALLVARGWPPHFTARAAWRGRGPHRALLCISARRQDDGYGDRRRRPVVVAARAMRACAPRESSTADLRGVCFRGRHLRRRARRASLLLAGRQGAAIASCGCHGHPLGLPPERCH
mmetsp:Transcript_11368/g.35062  ORF Transcript_11368/g.35062 Transcript_11368/m.35062 type:complete len:200 (+) Transcript_11368:498-1097(+)